jgi:hypothetical protein
MVQPDTTAERLRRSLHSLIHRQQPGEEVRGNPHLVIGQNAVFAGRPVRAPQTAREMASTAAENINKCRYQMLKMPAAMAISQLRLVDDLPGGHGLPTIGIDAGSESPTDPTALVARQ